MKKRTIKKQVPSYAFGINDDIGISNILGAGIQSLGGSDAKIAGGALSGAASGATAGIALGPIGAGIGGALGGLGGLASGLINRNKEKKRIRRENTRFSTMAGLDNAADTAQNYWSDNDLAYTYANGGMIPNDLAYLDNGEVFRSTNGDLIEMPTVSSTTDPFLVNTAGIESVLSNKLKNPLTKNTFAKDGERLGRRYRNSKGEDMFARNTNKLNDQNLQKEYDQLLMTQEIVKLKKGIQPKTKGIPAYAYGDDLKTFKTIPSLFTIPPDLNFGRTSITPEYNGIDGFTPLGRLPWIPGPAGGTVLDKPLTPETTNTRTAISTNKPATTSISPKSVRRPNTNLLNPIEGAKTGLNIPTIATKPSTFEGKITQPDYSKTSTDKEGFNLDGLNLGNLASLTPVLTNLIDSFSSDEVQTPLMNPYSGAINSTMARRRYNINPALDSNRRARAIAGYNASKYNPSTGANLALRSQLATNEMAANAELYGQKQNIENQYAADYSNMLNNLGQQYNSSLERVRETNAGNRASRRNLRRQAASQFGEWSQVQSQMNNQRGVQDMMFPLYADFLSQGMIQEIVNQLIRDYNKYRRNS